MTRKLKLFLLTGAMFIAPVAFSDCTPKVFNVNLGCPIGEPYARGDGTTDDRPAIQQCLLAAGEFYKECNEPTTPEVPVEVFFGPGTYFVSGAFRSAIIDPRVSSQWIALVLPRGVAMRGAGMIAAPGSGTTITIRKGTPDTDPRPLGGTGPRAGTYLIAAGVEKITKTERDPVTLQLTVLDRYCDEELPAGDAGPAGHPRPLCGGTQAELEKGGAYNAISDMILLGDAKAMVHHVDGLGSFAALSTAVYMTDGLKLKVERVRFEEWYRGVYASANGVDVRHSQFVNSVKAGLYLGGIAAGQEGGRAPLYVMPTYGENNHPFKFHIEGNWMGNETAWIDKLDQLRADLGLTWNPVQSLAGFLFTGAAIGTCGNLTFDGNRVYRARVVIDPPCHEQVVVTDNWISLSGLPISIGGGSGNFAQPSGFLFAKAIVQRNYIDTSLSGIAIQGCNFASYSLTGRCMHRMWDQALVEDNFLSAFKPFQGPGSDAYLNRMHGWVGMGSVFAGITIADTNGVEINDNHITDLKAGTQMAGIFTHTSYNNTRTADNGFPGTPSCYAPVQYNYNIFAYGNEIEYDSDAKANGYFGFPEHKLGFFTENTLNFKADRLSAPMVVSNNRTINTQITLFGDGLNVNHCYSDYGVDTCPRAMVNGEHTMSRDSRYRLNQLPNDPRHHCATQYKYFDEEFDRDGIVP